MTEANFIIVGRFGKVHGIKGLITLHSFTQPRANILNYKELYVRLDETWQPLSLLQLEERSKYILARVEGYPEREDVACLTNADLAIEENSLEILPEGEYYWQQLIGLNVLNQEGKNLGQVVDLMATGSNDVLIVEGDKRRLIPYLPEHFVLQVDLAQKQIIVDWDADF